jgi:hypothetical protein
VTYDPVNGQTVYVNGLPTGDADPSKGGTLANWDNTFALVLGNETTGQRQWQGTIKFVAIHSRALTPAQIQQNFAAGVGEKYYMLFNITALSGVPQSYILFQASQYDSYSYLFYQPKFISLDPTAMVPANLKIVGMRMGVNGSLAPAGQSYATMNATVGGANYTAANGQLLSPLGTVVPATLGPDSDLFFLAFDQVGSNVHAFSDPPIMVPPPALDPTPQPDFGVATFERINHSLSRITGVPITNPSSPWMVLYNNEQQSLPSTPQIAAFLPSHQTAISQLAAAYCGQMVNNAGLLHTFFNGALDGVTGNTAASFFASTANRNAVASALATNAVGVSVSPDAAAAVTAEVPALLGRVYSLKPSATVADATIAACTAVLGSAVVTLQ